MDQNSIFYLESPIIFISPPDLLTSAMKQNKLKIFRTLKQIAQRKIRTSSESNFSCAEVNANKLQQRTP
jgi:hypothetical protein